MAALLGSSGADEISVFHAVVEGNGTKPFKLALLPRLIAAQAEVPVEAVIATVAEADLVESSVEVAVIVTVSGDVPAGVKVTPVPEATPVAALSAPSAVGLKVRFTVLVKAPVPVTVGVQVEVCVPVMEVGEHTSETPVIAGAAAVTAMLAEPVMLV
jgi:hypothetical protein